ncbi:MAG: yngG [Firmicutes bacterium]|nr:yngG [Bacillota bacterium]
MEETKIVWPAEVEIVEVGPRDGLQNLPDYVPAETKIELIKRLAGAGTKIMEVTSFVHPKAVPQMADAVKVAEFAVQNADQLGFKPLALVPNLKGAQTAYATGLREVNYVISVSAAHNKANINRTIEASLEELENIIVALPELKINLSMATAFGCPFTGEVPTEDILRLTQSAIDRGVTTITLADTIGVANPVQTLGVIRAVQQAYPDISIGIHIHDTHGAGLANTLMAMSLGITRVESAVGGLGGCPFAPGAAGNMATEDLNNVLLRMGIRTGIDPVRYQESVSFVQEHIQASLLSHLSRARSYQEFSFYTNS